MLEAARCIKLKHTVTEKGHKYSHFDFILTINCEVTEGSLLIIINEPYQARFPIQLQTSSSKIYCKIIYYLVS